jgi:hypothetical protein
VSAAEAAARLYANALNQLAHAGDGLGAAIEIVNAARCYSLKRAELSKMLTAIEGMAA